jgi:uncharacterized protein (TIGR03118 family)
MKLRSLVPIAICAVGCVTAAAWADPPTRYQRAILTSDIPGAAPNTDPVLSNAWGIAFTTGGSPFWIADNATVCSTLYDGAGVPQPTTTPKPLRVKIPLPGNVISTACQPATPGTATPAAPTGLVFNPTTTFLVPGQSTDIPALFIWDTEDGTISAWAQGLTPADQAVLAVDESKEPPGGAVFKGLAFATNSSGTTLLFATNFRAATVEVFAPNGTTGYQRVTLSDGAFTDSNIPSGYAPFGIHNVGGVLFVTYALQNAAKHDDVAGQAHGFVDMFDADGHLIQRFAQRGQLNSPWGVVRASMAFGDLSGLILVGNFGDGTINAYDNSGRFVGTVRDASNKPLAIDGLWSLTLGGGKNSNPATLYFTAGPNGEMNGYFGTVAPIQ